MGSYRGFCEIDDRIEPQSKTRLALKALDPPGPASFPIRRIAEIIPSAWAVRNQGRNSTTMFCLVISTVVKRDWEYCGAVGGVGL